MPKYIEYNISQLRPYINWLYFYFAWGLSGKPQEEKDKLKAEADAMLDIFEARYHTHSAFGLFEANGDMDDIVIGDTRLPMLRQQRKADDGEPNMCLADFVRPLSQGIPDHIGVFATSIDSAVEHDFCDDDFQRMLAQTLADRLAEATAEVLHLQVRRSLWGYAPDEQLSIEQLLREEFQGIRPAVGYPSMPDTSINFIIDRLIDIKRIGIRLTESGAMKPHASVSGLMFAHPKARYFDIGKIDEEQLRDYAQRRHTPVELMRRFLAVRLQ
ncbi:vitamin B12 dependent-methionine synthase activation domain-containing protein [uncultured Prevotella sp.]|uniref:vitamin B12 dependent-methionine synthase activation domain-containing protein n=1 Tax=uncultured Prevotella sp. TaxID=159272 RepID=UPI0025E4777A|nr:vitamin B12 dependent-methionine synthase activation domain-containing protein [uncultured Prevotella sp.]